MRLLTITLNQKLYCRHCISVSHFVPNFTTSQATVPEDPPRGGQVQLASMIWRLSAASYIVQWCHLVKCSAFITPTTMGKGFSVSFHCRVHAIEKKMG